MVPFGPKTGNVDTDCYLSKSKKQNKNFKNKKYMGPIKQGGVEIFIYKQNWRMSLRCPIGRENHREKPIDILSMIWYGS